MGEVDFLSGLDPFGFSRHDNLAHQVITSNQLTMHIHPLPAEGRPENFTGAIGQFQVKGDAQPATVAMGEPVLLTFSVAGVGNFDYVRCPALGGQKLENLCARSHDNFQSKR